MWRFLFAWSTAWNIGFSLGFFSCRKLGFFSGRKLCSSIQPPIHVNDALVDNFNISKFDESHHILIAQSFDSKWHQLSIVTFFIQRCVPSSSTISTCTWSFLPMTSMIFQWFLNGKVVWCSRRKRTISGIGKLGNTLLNNPFPSSHAQIILRWLKSWNGSKLKKKKTCLKRNCYTISCYNNSTLSWGTILVHISNSELLIFYRFYWFPSRKNDNEMSRQFPKPL